MTEAMLVFHVVCDMKCHRHCAARAKPCTVVVDTSMVVNRENEKVVTSVEDVDKLGRFLLEKVCNKLCSEPSLLHCGHLQITLLGKVDTEVERSFTTALQEFHTNLISQYSLAVQVSM